MPEAERLQGVQQHDVQIAVDAAVLEGVVQHDQLALELLDRQPGGRHAVGILQMRHVGQLLLQFQRLVVLRPASAP